MAKINKVFWSGRLKGMIKGIEHGRIKIYLDHYQMDKGTNLLLLLLPPSILENRASIICSTCNNKCVGEERSSICISRRMLYRFMIEANFHGNNVQVLARAKKDLVL